MALSVSKGNVEGLTTLSHVEGQYPMIKIQMIQTMRPWALFCFGHWGIGYSNLFRISNLGHADSLN